MNGLSEIECYRGVAIMFNVIMGKYYFYPEFTKRARYFDTFESACEAVDRL